MSDLSARKTPVITISPDAASKKLDETKDKFTLTKREGKFSVGTKPLSQDVKNEFSVREGGELKKIRIATPPKSILSATKPSETTLNSLVSVSAPVKENIEKEEKVDLSLSDLSVPKEKAEQSEKMSLSTAPIERKAESPRLDLLPDLSTYRLSSVVGASLTGLWFLITTIYAVFYMGVGDFLSQQPHILGGFLAGILAPVALLWMIIGQIQRTGDMRQYAIVLGRELKNLNFGSEKSEKKQKVDITPESKSALHSIHKARAGLRSEIKHLNSISEKTGEQLEKLNTNLSDRAAKLLNMTQEIEERASSLDKITVAKFASVPAPQYTGATNITSSVLSNTDGISEKMDARIKDLNEVLGKMEGTLGNIENKGAKTAEKLSEKVEQLSKTTEESTHKITSVLGLVDNGREKMEQTSQAMGEQATTISKAQNELTKRVDEMQMKVSEPLSAVNRAVDKAIEAHSEIEGALDKRVEALNLASEKASKTTTEIREGLRNQTKEMSTLMGQISGHSRSVKSMLQDENENLAENIKKALDQVDVAGKSLEGQSEKIQGITSSAEERINNLSKAISSHSMDAVKNTGNVISDFKAIESVLLENVKSILSQTTEAKTAVSGIAIDAQKSADIINPIYTESLEKIEGTQERFEKLASGFEEKTKTNIDKLESFETLFDERLKTLSSSAEDAAHILERSSNNLGERVNDIDSAAQTAEEKLQNIDSLFKNHVSDIHLTTDEALLKISNVQKLMDTHYQDLSASVAESLAQMQDVGEQFVKQTEQVQKLSSSAVEGLDTAGGKANEKIKTLHKLAKNTTTQMEEMFQKVQNEAEHLLKTSSVTLEQMKKTGEDFAERSKFLEEQMNSSVENTKKHGKDLDKQVSNISKTSLRSTEDIEKAMAQLATKLLDVKEVSKDVSGAVTTSRNKMSSETEHWADVSLKAARVVEEAASSYLRQSGELSKATELAANHIDKVRQGDWRVQRDTFLNGTRFILESLHSLSVDLTRMVDGDIQEKIWKAYQKGDIAVFTRRLIETREKLPLEKMKEKYMADNEFRTYVNRFIRQFEDVYEQGSSNDYGELISATFASSDVGGLYDILCDVAGRKSMVKKLGRRAA